MPDRSKKRPRDRNQLARFVVDASSGARHDEPVTQRDNGASEVYFCGHTIAELTNE